MHYTDLTPYEYDLKGKFRSIVNEIRELQNNIKLKPPLNLILRKERAFKFVAFIINSFSKFHIKRKVLGKLLLPLVNYDNYSHFRHILYTVDNYKIRLAIAQAFLNAVNVGWLSSQHSYPTGNTSAEFHAKLFKFCLYPYWGHRGYHQCDLKPCTGNREKLTITHSRETKHLPNLGMIIATHGRTTKQLGANVIIVIGKNRNYAAPDLIYHCVTDHNYRPPDEFIDAVMISKPFKGAPAW